jgi:uncharacterized lipoprotein YehR (DUF1307 family)
MEDYYYDRTPKKHSQDSIGGFSMKREYTNTRISIQYYNIQVINQLLHIKYHVLRFTKDETQKILQQIYQSFAEALSLTISTFYSP